MRDENDGLAQLALQAQEFVLHLPTDQRVQRRKRLVEKPQIRTNRQRPRNADPLLLATRQLVGIRGLAALQSDEFDHLTRAGFAGWLILTLQL